MRNAVFLLIAVGFLAVNASAQGTKTITNLDLEKYRQARLAAEKDLRENYERLGFPSPEEMEKQQEKERLDRERLSEKLRAERFQREQAEAANNAAAAPDQVIIAPVPQYSGGASVFYTGPYNRRYGRGYYPRYNYPIQGYRATPVGVYPVPLPQPPPRPVFRPHRPRR